jgi:hypothetical protein
MPFGFNEKREEINDAHGSIVLPLTGLTMTRLALGDTTNNIGQADTYYTDNSVNTANSDMFTNYAPNYFSIPTGETSAYFNNTFAGDPMPLKDNVNSGGFCGTCKPVALGDYINSNTLGSTLDGSFAIAGISSGDVYLSIFSTDQTAITATFKISANCGISMSGSDADIRLFAHPDLYTSSTVKTIIVIVNDYLTPNRLYFFMFDWDHSPSNSLTLISQTFVTSTVSDNIKYTGKHDIFFIPSVNKLLLLRKDAILEELDIIPGTSISSTAAKIDITAVAVDEVNRIITKTDINGDLKTYINTITTTPTATSFGAVLTTVFDGCYYNNGVDPSGFYFCAVDSVNSEVVSYRFETDASGNITASNSYVTTGVTTTNWTQVEVPHYNVLNIGVGPDNKSGIAIARVVCDSLTLRATYNEYANPFNIEDFILMRHPAGNNSINGNSAGGSGHLISVDNGSTITTFSNNFLNNVENVTSTSSITSTFQYIIYLGYFDNNATSNVNYLYLAISGLSGAASFDINGNSAAGGYYFYFNYDA